MHTPPLSAAGRLWSSCGKKILGSLMAVGVAGTMAGLGTFATFTDTETGSTAVDSGIVSMTIGTANTAANRLAVAAIDIVPGDTIQRAVNLTVDSSTTSNLASIKLTTSASPTSALDTNAIDGLQMKIERCSEAWTESGTSPAFTYTCDGTRTKTTVLARRAIIGSDLDLSTALGLAAGTTNHLVITVDLPTTAGNTFQNLASTVTYSFTGTQRAATNK